MKKKCIFLLWIIILISILGTLSCVIKKNNSIFSQKNKITLVANIPETWPQYFAMKHIVKDYNKNHKNHENFMEVVFLSQKDIKTTNLDGKINKFISSNSKDLPNLLLGRNFGEIYELASFNKLMNLSSKKIRVNDFNNYFIKNLESLPIKNYEKGLWALPTMAIANNSLIINKPVLKKIFNLMKNHGASISKKDNNIIQSIMKNNNELSSYNRSLIKGYRENSSSIPLKIWVDRKKNINDDLKNYTIDDSIFKTYENLYDFLNKAHNSLKLKKPLYIYGSGVLHDFLNILDSQRNENEKWTSLFKSIPNGKYVFPFLKNKNEQKKLENVFEKLLKPAKGGYGDYPENFNIIGLRNGQYAISTQFSVSARYSYKSEVFGNYTNNGFAFNDILYLQNPLKWNNESLYNSSSPSNWFLMGIKVNDKKDKAVKMFINFLYNGTLKKDNEQFKNNPRKVVDYLQWESGYLIPLKSSLNIDEDFNSIYKKLENKDFKNHKYGAIYRSLKNLKNTIKNSNNLRSFNGNQYTEKLLKIIDNIIQTALKNPKDWTGKKFVTEIIKNKNDFFH